MGTGYNSGLFGSSTGAKKSTYSKIAKSLPKNPNTLLSRGWVEVTHEKMGKNTQLREFYNSDYNLKIRFDKAKVGKSGFEGVDHYHMYNPESTGKKDYYLDIDGNPVPKNSKKSHIIAGGKKK